MILHDDGLLARKAASQDDDDLARLQVQTIYLEGLREQHRRGNVLLLGRIGGRRFAFPHLEKLDHVAKPRGKGRGQKRKVKSQKSVNPHTCSPP